MAWVAKINAAAAAFAIAEQHENRDANQHVDATSHGEHKVDISPCRAIDEGFSADLDDAGSHSGHGVRRRTIQDILASSGTKAMLQTSGPNGSQDHYTSTEMHTELPQPFASFSRSLNHIQESTRALHKLTKDSETEALQPQIRSNFVCGCVLVCMRMCIHSGIVDAMDPTFMRHTR
jgi:hypothetical protein